MRTVLSQLAARGYRGRMVAIQHLHDLQEEWEGWLSQVLPDEKVRQEYSSGLSFDPPDSLPGARSIVVIALPQPRTRFTFTWHGRELALDVPPTYLYWREADQHACDMLAAILKARGYQVAPAMLPEKLLVVRSGLGAYGRNCISYVPGLGSFYRPTALYTDLPCPVDEWHDLRMLDRCRDCAACRQNCPAGAIPAGGLLLRAERCLTLHNERPADVPFPPWIEPDWHNCLVGCLHCQRVCPENRGVWPWVVDGASFTEQETTLLREGTSLDRLPAATMEKLQQSGLVDYSDVLQRNLAAALSQDRDRRTGSR
jgi:epoxyqueuosine reductase